MVFQTISPSQPPSVCCNEQRCVIAPASGAGTGGRSAGIDDVSRPACVVIPVFISVFMVLKQLLRCQMSTQEAHEELATMQKPAKAYLR